MPTITPVGDVIRSPTTARNLILCFDGTGDSNDADVS